MPVEWLAIALASLLVVQSHQPTHRGSASRRVRRPVSISAADVNNPNQPQVGQGAKGSAVLRAQILLARAHFSCGEIDGDFGTNLQTTVRAFQQERGLPASGMMDDATWNALAGNTAPAVTNFAIDPKDVQGPFISIPADITQQARLPALGYTSALEAISERFHASPEVMRQLNPSLDVPRAGQQINAPNVVTMPPGPAAQIAVSKGESSVRSFDISGKLLSFYMATTGSEHDPLPLGQWKVLGVAHNPKFHYNAKLFWDAKNVNDRATIQPGPNNPVGTVWIDLSKPHYGIHGTPEPGKVGHTYSHGCIRLTNWDAEELAAMVKPGTPAILRD